MIQRARRKRMIEKSGAKIKLGMMRHLFIVMDMSECMKLQVITHTFMILLKLCLKLQYKIGDPDNATILK